MNLCGVILSVVRCGVDTMASLNQGFDPIGAELFMVRCATYYVFFEFNFMSFSVTLATIKEIHVQIAPCFS